MHIWSGGAAHDRASACVVIAAAALLATSFGTAYAIPAFFPILIKKLAIPSGHLTALFSATGALYFSLGLVIGPVADRNGARRIAMLGQLVLASGLVLISLARSETTFDIAYLLGVGVGVGVGLCFVPAKGAVQAVCWRSPALAGGLAASGIGVGTLVEPPLVQGMIDHFGWRGALDATSVLAICGMFVALLLPQTAKPSGSRVATASDRPQQLDKFLSAERLALLYTAQLFLSIVAFVPLAHLVLFARAKGFSAGTGVRADWRDRPREPVRSNTARLHCAKGRFMPVGGGLRNNHGDRAHGSERVFGCMGTRMRRYALRIGIWGRHRASRPGCRGNFGTSRDLSLARLRGDITGGRDPDRTLGRRGHGQAAGILQSPVFELRPTGPDCCIPFRAASSSAPSLRWRAGSGVR